MPLTVAGLEADLILVYGGLMSAAGMATDPAGTPNPDLRTSLASAGRIVGVAMADPLALADPDLAAFDVAGTQKLLDVAKLYTVEACLGRYTDFDTNINSGYEQKVDQVRRAMIGELARLQKLVLDRYGIGAPTAPVFVGQACLDFPTPGTRGWGVGDFRTDH